MQIMVKAGKAEAAGWSDIMLRKQQLLQTYKLLKENRKLKH